MPLQAHLRRQRHVIRFPANAPHSLAQDEAYFVLHTPEGDREIRFHDYTTIYRIPGLYEQVFYERLKCVSPATVVDHLCAAVDNAGGNFTELRVLDVGAGNGLVGVELARHGASRLVGLDIDSSARDAAERDYPGTYDAYHIANLTTLSQEAAEDLQSWRFSAMTCVAALGFNDIPPEAFRTAFGFVEVGGWVAFNIKESFFSDSDTSGFSTLIKQSLFSGALDLHRLERYRHRVSIDGAPLYYFAIVGRKAGPLPAS